MRPPGKAGGLISAVVVLLSMGLAVTVSPPEPSGEPASGAQRGPRAPAPDQALLVSAQGNDPCAHLGPFHVTTEGCCWELCGDWTIADWAHGKLVAKGVITAVTAPRFDTEDGLPPPPLPTDAPDEAWDTYHDRIISAVVVDATHIYTGPPATGYVFIRWGGTSPYCPDFEYIAERQPILGDVGDEVMIFGSDAYLGLPFPEDPPNWLQYALDVAAEWNSNPDVHYEAMAAENWYLYQPDGYAVSSCWGSMPIAQLEEEVEAFFAP